MELIEQRIERLRARREERRALLRAGAALPPSAELAALDGRIAALAAALDSSLARDRADWAAAPGWARPLVVARGLLDRAVLRALRLQARRERTLACVRHGASQPDAQARLAIERRERAEAALRPLPRAVREAGHFGRIVAREARGRLLPRLPGLAGLAVGWWIAQTFTDSELSAALHRFGLGSGPRHAVGTGTLKAMGFWLPLLAAALCSYAGTRLARRVKARYALPPEAGAPAPQRPPGQSISSDSGASSARITS